MSLWKKFQIFCHYRQQGLTFLQAYVHTVVEIHLHELAFYMSQMEPGEFDNFKKEST
jgi:hypothetical protein